MNSLALFMVDLQMAQGRFIRAFDVLDEMSTAQTPKIKKGQRAGKRVWRAAKALWTFVDHGFDFRKAMEIGIHRAARLSSRAALR
jgi:hypothetical protein